MIEMEKAFAIGLALLVIGLGVGYELGLDDGAIAVYKNEIVCKQVINDWHCEEVKAKQ